MIQTIENWFDEINLAFGRHRRSCSEFEDALNDFYSPSFLRKAYFVLVDEIPKPEFPELRRIGIDEFIDKPLKRITYKNTYFLLKQFAGELRLHVHELVHVAQWTVLGPENFLKRYLLEIQQYGYDNAPLEKMANALERRYASNLGPINFSLMVQSHT